MLLICDGYDDSYIQRAYTVTSARSVRIPWNIVLNFVYQTSPHIPVYPRRRTSNLHVSRYSSIVAIGRESGTDIQEAFNILIRSA